MSDEIKTPIIEEEEQDYGSTAEFKHGTVTCKKLNVRESRSLEAKILEVIAENQLVVIVDDKESPSWYKVITEAGIEGYCICDFIKLVD